MMHTVKRVSRTTRWLSIVVTALLTCGLVAPSSVRAQGSPPALAPGAARGPGEAPGGAPLAPEPAASGAADPSADRGMAFSSTGGPQCRDTVPGGTLLVVAYAITIALMGAYVAFLGWKNVQLARAVETLEGQIAKHTPTGAKKPATDDA